MNLKENECTHENVQFIGLYSMIGNYHCEDCGAIIEPVEYHRTHGMPHISLQLDKIDEIG